METAIDSRKYLEDLGVPPVGMTTKIEKFRLSSHPLGNEIDIWWEYSDDNGNITIPSNYQFYLFKRCEQEVTDEEIYNYITWSVNNYIYRLDCCLYLLRNGSRENCIHRQKMQASPTAMTLLK